MYDTDRDDDSDTDPEEDRRRRELHAMEPSRRPRDAPGEPLSEEARRRRSGSESLSRHDSLGKRGSQGAPAASCAPPKSTGTGPHAVSRVSGILNAIPRPAGRLSAPKPMMPVGAAAAPRVKDTSFEERARALADEKKRKAAEATAAEAAAAEAERAAMKRARLAKEAKGAKEAARVVPKPEPETIVVADVDDAIAEYAESLLDEGGPADEREVVVDDDDDLDDDLEVVRDDDEDGEARREAIRAAKKLKKEKKLKKRMSDASAKSVEKSAEPSVEDRQAPPIAPLGGKVPRDAVEIIHTQKFRAYHFFARDVYVQKLFRETGASVKDTPDLSIRRFRATPNDTEPTEVKFENTDTKGKSGKQSILILRSFISLFRWAVREWGRDSDDLKRFFQEYGAGKKPFKDAMDGKD